MTTAPGAGASFSILLPESEDEAVAEPRAARVELPGGNETLLVVEDDGAVRRAIVETLRRLGYAVLQAESGAAALRLVASHVGPIHLALTDVIMPALGGYELATRLRDARPATAILFMSGHTSDSQEGPSEALLLQKPFDPAVLAFRIREALDAAAKGAP